MRETRSGSVWTLSGTYRPGSRRLPADLSGKFSGRGPLLFLLRHGQIQGKGRFIGQTDLPLDETGIAQALTWQPVFEPISFSRIFVSGLARCRDMAGLCCPGQPVVQEARINEIHLGDWEGQSLDRIRQQFPEAFARRGREIYRFRPPGGESFEDLFVRASPFFDQLASAAPDSGHTLVITHAGVIRVMSCRWRGLPMDQLFSLRPEYGGLFVYEPGKAGEARNPP